MSLRFASTPATTVALLTLMADAPAALAQDYPVTLTNCGEEVTIDAAPQRIVTGTQQAAEILIHLGVTDRLVGTAYEVDVVPEDIASEYESVPQLVERGQFVNHEVLLEAQPDFFYSTFGNDLTAQRAGLREELADLGVPSYVSEFSCYAHAGLEDPSFDLLFEEYRNLGAILGVPEAAEELIAEQQQLIDDAVAERGDETAPMSVLWFYSDFAGTPWVAGGGGITQNISDLVGVENVFADAEDSWIETSYEEIAARNPDVIIVANLTRGRVNDSAEEKITLLTTDPLTQELDAVVNDRLIIMSGKAMDISFGSVQLVPELVEGLAQFE